MINIYQKLNSSILSNLRWKWEFPSSKIDPKPVKTIIILYRFESIFRVIFFLKISQNTNTDPTKLFITLTSTKYLKNNWSCNYLHIPLSSNCFYPMKKKNSMNNAFAARWLIWFHDFRSKNEIKRVAFRCGMVSIMNLLRNPLVDRLPLIVEPWLVAADFMRRHSTNLFSRWCMNSRMRKSEFNLTIFVSLSQKFLFHYFWFENKYIYKFYFEISITSFIIMILIYIIIITSSRSFRPRISFEFWTWRHLVLTGRELTYNRNRGFDGSFDIDCLKWIFST